MSIERQLAAQILTDIRNDNKNNVEHYYSLYSREFNHLGWNANQELHGRINKKYSAYMVRKYVKEKEKCLEQKNKLKYTD